MITKNSWANFAKLTACAALLTAVVASPVHHANAETVLRLGHTTTPESGYGVFATTWAQKASELSGGDINIKVFHNAQLGDEKALIEAMRLGTVDAAIITSDVLVSHVPEFTVLGLPMAFSSYDQAHEFQNGPGGKMLLDKLASVDLVGFSYADVSFRSIGNNIRPINKPDDLKGIKLRVIQSPLPIKVMEALGASPTPIAWQETVPALKQGVVDGLATGNAYYYIGRVYDYTKYFSFTNHAYSAMLSLVSKSRFNSLDKKTQDTLRDAAVAAAPAANKVLADIEMKMVPLMEKEGTIINRISDVAPFREKVQPIWADFEEKIGAELMAELRKIQK